MTLTIILSISAFALAAVNIALVLMLQKQDRAAKPSIESELIEGLRDMTALTIDMADRTNRVLADAARIELSPTPQMSRAPATRVTTFKPTPSTQILRDDIGYHDGDMPDED